MENKLFTYSYNFYDKVDFAETAHFFFVFAAPPSFIQRSLFDKLTSRKSGSRTDGRLRWI